MVMFSVDMYFVIVGIILVCVVISCRLLVLVIVVLICNFVNIIVIISGRSVIVNIFYWIG